MSATAGNAGCLPAAVDIRFRTFSCATIDAPRPTLAERLAVRERGARVAAHVLMQAAPERDPTLRPVRGIFAAQQIKPQAKVLAAARGITCVEVDYDALRGIESDVLSLF